METKQPIELGQQGMETEQKVESEKSVDFSDNTTGEDVSTSKLKILKSVWAFCLQHKLIAAVASVGVLLGGIGTFYSAFRSNSSDTTTNIEEVIIINHAPKSAELVEVEKKFKKIEENPDASVLDRAVVEAYRLKQAGKIDDSIEKWSSIANISEGIDNDLAAGAWFAVGTLSMQKGKKDEEILVYSYDKSIFLPGYLDKPFLLTTSYLGQDVNRDIIEKAISFFNHAIRLKSDFSEAYLNRGSAKFALKKHNEAITDYDKVLELDPDFVEVYTNRGIAKNALGKHKEAVADHDKTILLKPDFAAAYNNRGIAKVDLGQYESAILDYNETIRLKPDFAGVYSNRGIALAALGQYESALC